MKKFSKSIRFMLATLLVIAVSQANLFAGNNVRTDAGTGLTAMQAAGAFALVVLAILLPLVKSQRVDAAR